jgi:hypothetical protein
MPRLPTLIVTFHPSIPDTFVYNAVDALQNLDCLTTVTMNHTRNRPPLFTFFHLSLSLSLSLSLFYFPEIIVFISDMSSFTREYSKNFDASMLMIREIVFKEKVF